MQTTLNVVFLGLSITSSWGNGHATIYRALFREMIARGWRVLFLERDVPWYAAHRDTPEELEPVTALYDSIAELERYQQRVRNADAVVVGSYVPEGITVGEWVIATTRNIRAFYDIDTPITIGNVERGACEYLSPSLIASYDLYLSFAGGPILRELEGKYHSPMARAFYCTVDPKRYRPMSLPLRYDLGYMGTYSEDRQPALEKLLIEPARQRPAASFTVAGPQYPQSIAWPPNIQRIEHLGPDSHPAFYNEQKLTLNVTREAMVRAGYSPSVRLFEAAACGTPIVSDWWEGLDSIFEIGSEIYVSRSAEETLSILDRTSERERQILGSQARERVLAGHTAARRVDQFLGLLEEASHRTAGSTVAS